MIKRSIASILIILIFINSIGCMSYEQIRTDDKNEIEKANMIRLTTVNNKKYFLKNITATDSTISGNQWVQNKIMKRRIEFSFDQISKIEAEEFHISTTGFGIVIGIIVAYLGIGLATLKI